MYLPGSFAVTDPEKLSAFVSRYSFATLVTTVDGVPFATHLPLLHRARGDGLGALVGHVARANPHWQAFDGQSESLAIFTGPHAYVSPSWYETELAVPTWNYLAVHVYGIARVIYDETWLAQLLDETVQRYESERPQPWPNPLPDDFRRNLMKSIVGFEIPITRWEGKFKLSQNRSEQDRSNVQRELSQSPNHTAQQIAEWMTSEGIA